MPGGVVVMLAIFPVNITIKRVIERVVHISLVGRLGLQRLPLVSKLLAVLAEVILIACGIHRVNGVVHEIVHHTLRPLVVLMLLMRWHFREHQQHKEH